jgi:hypothetical protein
MKKAQVLILGREDLINPQYKALSQLKLSELKGATRDTMRTIAQQNIVLFIDDNGETRIIKNRYGDEGKIMRKKGLGQKNAIPKTPRKIKNIGVVALSVEDFLRWKQDHKHIPSKKHRDNIREYTCRGKHYVCLSRPTNCYGYSFDELQETGRAYMNDKYREIFIAARRGLKTK